jgi:hypothetical protein
MNLESDECSVAISYLLLASSPHLLTVPTPPPAETASTGGNEEKKAERKYELQENVDYGAVAANLPGHGSEKYYLSTAIAYTNGYPHIGHAYEVFVSSLSYSSNSFE